MRVQSAALVSIVLLGRIWCPEAHADPIRTTVTIGATDGSNGFPFGSGPDQEFEYRGVYQQIYAASSFNGQLSIDQIAFSTTPFGERLSISSSFALSLGTTASSPENLAPSYAANRRTDLTELFTGTVGVAAGGGGFDFIIPLSAPFVYEPSGGNLLLEVFIRENSESWSFQAGSSNATGRVFNFGGTGDTVAEPNFGLLTQFSGSQEDTAPVPEPATILLVAGGLLGICRASRHNVGRT
jgi:hypothetical protein